MRFNGVFQHTCNFLVVWGKLHLLTVSQDKFCLQNIEEDYGMSVWPCSVILAEYVWQQRSRFSGLKVVEVLLIFGLP